MQLSTAGLARSSAQHPWRVVGFWILMLALSAGLIGGPGLNLTSSFDFLTNPESKQGFTLLEERMGIDNPLTETVIVTSETMTVDDPAFEAAVGEVMTTLRGLPELVNTDSTALFSYYDALGAGSPAAEQLVSEDRHTTLIPVTLLTDLEQLEESEPVVDAIDGMSIDGFDVLTVGDVSVNMVFNETAETDLRKGEAFGVPMALIILVIVFGALVAAGVPIILAAISITLAVGATAAISQLTDLSFFITNMISMIGLAVGIDYALFVVERYREERRHGFNKMDAIEMAGATASKAVLFSGITVVLALIGLFLIPTTIFRSLGLGAILVVIAAVLVMLTLVPALLALLGDKLDWPRKRHYPTERQLPEQYDAEHTKSGFWGRVTHAVMARPVISLVIAVALLLAAAIPYFDLNTGFAGAETLPESRARDGFMILQRDFSVGLLAPVEIVVDATQSAETDAAIETMRQQIAANPVYDAGTFSVTWNEAKDLAHITVAMNLNGSSPEAVDQIGILRNDVIPAAFGDMTSDVYVTGDTAFNSDFFDLVDRWTPLVFIFVLGLSFFLLLIAFRSIVVPIKAILMNLLSVGAAYGLVVLVFQKGYGADFFGFQQTPTIEAWIPIFLFCVLFGLSMDYHVFLISRIREHYDQTGRNRESVAVGLQSTARIITGAALIMVSVFAGFAAGNLVMLQQMGFGLAVAVLIDATIIRTIIVPAAMALLGDKNWYLPSWLHWLPDIRVEGRTVEAANGKTAPPQGVEGAVAD